MDRVIDWTLKAIRSQEPMMSWLEERRFEWVPLVNDFVSKIIDGTTIILITDHQREWFAKYVLTTLNSKKKNRPILPIFTISNMLNTSNIIENSEDIELIIDMLTMSTNNKFVFWYVGTPDLKESKLAKKRDDSFMWLMDEEMQNSFFLRSTDDLLDIKLLHLTRLLDKTIDAAMFNKIELE